MTTKGNAASKKVSQLLNIIAYGAQGNNFLIYQQISVLRAINRMFIICQFGDFYSFFNAHFFGYFPAPAVSPFTKNFRKRGYVTRTGTIMITASAILYDSVGIRVAIAPEILSFVARNVALFSRL